MSSLGHLLRYESSVKKFCHLEQEIGEELGRKQCFKRSDTITLQKRHSILKKIVPFIAMLTRKENWDQDFGNKP